MKTKVIKFLGAAIIAAFAQNANAQWNWASPDVELTNPSDNVGLGLTPVFKLDVRGDVNISAGNSYRIGGNAIVRTDASNGLYLGLGTGLFTTVEGTFVGHNAGNANTTGRFNSFMGIDAGKFNTTGSENTFMGFEAGKANDSGANNTFMGAYAGKSTTIGLGNTFIGTYSGAFNATGGSNTYVGKGAAKLCMTGSLNTVMGTGAAGSMQTSENTAIGANALHNNTTGSQNTALGCDAGKGTGTPGTGAGNTFLGYSAGVYNNNGNNNVYVGGASAVTSGMTNKNNNTFVGTNTNLVGNGNSVLGYNVSGTGDYNLLLGYGNTTIGSINYSAAIGAYANVATDNTLVLGHYLNNITTVIGSDGNWIGGGTYQLEVNGDAYATGIWGPSDANFKKNIKAYSNAMDVINQLNPVSYYYKDDVYFDHKDKDGKQVKRNFAKEEQIGFLAQDLEKVLPNMVRTHKDGTKAVNYNQLFGVLTQGIKEQSATTAENKNEIATLKEENTKLATLINELAISNKELKSRLDAIEQKAGNSNTDTKKEIPADLKGKIEQIAPNPFSENVVVNYFVPQTAAKANMVLRSDKATQSVSFDINNKGNNSITLSGTNLLTGLYLCELYVDGQLVDTQKIMLVK